MLGSVTVLLFSNSILVSVLLRTRLITATVNTDTVSITYLPVSRIDLSS